MKRKHRVRVYRNDDGEWAWMCHGCAEPLLDWPWPSYSDHRGSGWDYAFTFAFGHARRAD